MESNGRITLTFLFIMSFSAPNMAADSIPAQPPSGLRAASKSSPSGLSAQMEPLTPIANRTSSPYVAVPASYRTQATNSTVKGNTSASAVIPEAEVGAVEREDKGNEGTDEKDNETEEQEEDDEEEEGEDEEEETPATLLEERWHQAGPVTAQYLYTGEVFNNTRGGISTKNATRYRGNFDLTLSLDTGKACWWEGGEFFAYAQQSHGQTLTQSFVGDGQYYSNIDTGLDQNVTQMAEYWYQHTFSEELSVKLGRQDANENFAFADLGGDFINASFVTLANIPLPTWPYQTLGVSTLYQPTNKLRLGGGMYDHGRDYAQWWTTTASRGMFFIGQADYQPCAECKDAPLTLLRIGGWYTNSDTLTVDGAGVFEGNYGFYATLDRMLLTECEDPDQGLGTFLQFSWAPQDRNQVDLNYGGGLVYRGLLPRRNEDTIGVGLSVIEFSPDLDNLTGQTYENAIEVFYKARIKDGLNIQPDLQYIVRPSGTQRDALVVGIRFEANF
ncbi:MAG: carbohydrate porin [Planctomycetota bacterium]|nr:carbohydrate porin [Planctomycetota bacterium]